MIQEELYAGSLRGLKHTKSEAIAYFLHQEMQQNDKPASNANRKQSIFIRYDRTGRGILGGLHILFSGLQKSGKRMVTVVFCIEEIAGHFERTV